LQQVALVRREQSHRHQQAYDAEIQGRPEFFANREKDQVVNGHGENGAEDEKVEAALQVVQTAYFGFRPQGDQIPHSAPAVMKVGYLQEDFDVLGSRLEGNDRRELAGTGGCGGHPGQSGRSCWLPVDVYRVSGRDFFHFQG
jgi:hypothetical protein